MHDLARSPGPGSSGLPLGVYPYGLALPGLVAGPGRPPAPVGGQGGGPKPGQAAYMNFSYFELQNHLRQI